VILYEAHPIFTFQPYFFNTFASVHLSILNRWVILGQGDIICHDAFDLAVEDSEAPEETNSGG
jgi:hypothetical protein